ncbi:hypothetical protein FF36_03375 [Frankia torreyi]|uniref:Uncharacterized protein n=1 Tax=Frankia torreyi TaxID=1856 RepID=A0A0D8BDQ7_9ACTN|nr:MULTISPECIES: hypothetical protein [Frankia]KJE22306.1 hypothetical protein FF36_03375 [Frankia torreyi]KQM05102.1 hypothetical protein FF86_101952 [Frankia sp. CpI1-P]
MQPDIADPTQPAFLATYLAGLPQPDHDHAGPARSVREDDFDGHHVVITTTYEITVDGQPLNVHIGLSNDGSAHCHGLPAYQLPSLVDLVRVLIRTFPDEFSPHPTPGDGHDGDGHDGQHSHDHGDGDGRIHGDETSGGR